jgi:hypothetical protein
MTFGGRTYFVGTFAVVFHLAVIAGIFYVSWTGAPSVNAPSVNVVGSMQQPRAVRTITISPSPASGSDRKDGPGLFGGSLQQEEDEPRDHRRLPILRERR